jgi:hypothetical protein
LFAPGVVGAIRISASLIGIPLYVCTARRARCARGFATDTVMVTQPPVTASDAGFGSTNVPGMNALAATIGALDDVSGDPPASDTQRSTQTTISLHRPRNWLLGCAPDCINAWSISCRTRVPSVVSESPSAIRFPFPYHAPFTACPSSEKPSEFGTTYHATVS